MLKSFSARGASPPGTPHRGFAPGPDIFQQYPCNLPTLLPLPGYPYYHCCYSLTYHTLTPTSTLPVFIFLPYLTSYHYTYSLPNHPLTLTPTILCPSSILPYSALPCPTPPNPTLSNPILTPITYPTLPYHYSLLYPTLSPTSLFIILTLPSTRVFPSTSKY